MTQVVNDGIKQATAVSEMLAQDQVQKRSLKEETNLLSKGVNVDTNSINEARKNIGQETKSALNKIAIGEGIAALGQGLLGYMHVRSNKKVDAAATDANKDIKDSRDQALLDLSTCTKNKGLYCQENYNQKISTLDAMTDNVKNNKLGEKNQQVNYAALQAVQTADTAMKALRHHSEAKAVGGITYTGPQIQAPHYTIGDNPGETVQPGVDPAINPNPTESALVDSTQNADTKKFDAPAQVDLGNNNELPKGPDAPHLMADAGTAQGQIGGGGGGGGSTSAAHPDEGGAQAPGSKTKEGGNYGDSGAGGGSGGSRGSRGAEGAGVGMDGAFADLLKKLMPGGEEEKPKAQGPIVFSDRTPASDQAAVIGRGKNIFDEIHKRYLKKNTEGALVF
jgi:hypothetical protein